jgi:hypothetical protein
MEHKTFSRVLPTPTVEVIEDLYVPEFFNLGLPIGRVRGAEDSLVGSFEPSDGFHDALRAYHKHKSYAQYVRDVLSLGEPHKGHPAADPRFAAEVRLPRTAQHLKKSAANRVQPWPLAWVYLWVYNGFWPPKDDVTPVLTPEYRQRARLAPMWYPPVLPDDIGYIAGFATRIARRRGRPTRRAPWGEQQFEATMILCTDPAIPTSEGTAIPAAEALLVLMNRGIEEDEAIVALGRIVEDYARKDPQPVGYTPRARNGKVWREKGRVISL